MSKSVLIGEISSYKAIVISCFIKTYYPSVKIYGYGFNKHFSKLHTKYVDHFFNLNGTGEQKTDLKLSGIISEYDIQYFFPVDSSHIGKYIKNRNLFGNALDYMGSFESYNILDNKAGLTELAQRLGILTPKTFKTLDEVTYPAVVKPVNLSSSTGVIYLRDQKWLKKLSSHSQWDKNLIIQEYVSGQGAGLSTFCHQGKILISYGHKRIAEYPVTGGSSVYREGFINEQMLRIAVPIIQYTNWSGFAMFEFKIKADETTVLIEVNPRIWGSINQGLINGVNYFGFLLGLPERTIPPSGNLNSYLSPLIYLAFIKYLFRMDLLPLLTFLRNHRRNSPDICLSDDPKGWASTIMRQL